MRIVMLGTGPFAVPTLAALLDSGHEIPALITRPTPPAKGREKVSLNPMRDLAESRGLPVFAPDSINSPEAHQLLSELKPDLLMVCDYGQILSRDTISLVPLGGINLHASLLPKYRGAAPIHWAILSGESQTGISVIHITPKLDGGPLLAQVAIDILPTESMAELEQRLALIGVPAVMQSIEQLAQWDRVSPIGTLQDPAKVTKAPRLQKAQGAISWNSPSQSVLNQLRAFKPWPASYTHWLRPNAEPLRLIVDQAGIPVDASGLPPSPPGTIQITSDKRLLVATQDGWLQLHAVQPAGKRLMESGEFLRGNPLVSGQLMGNPPAITS